MTSKTPLKKKQSAKERHELPQPPHIRILHVISGLGPGGAETVLFRLATQSDEIAHEVICLGQRDWYSDRLEERGIKVHHVDLSSPIRAITGTVHLRRLVQASNADLVQGWMYRGNVFGGLAGWIAGKKVLWNIRCSRFDLLPIPTRALAYFGGLLARWVPALVVNCSVVSRELHARIGYGAVEGVVIANGYDPATFQPDEQARSETRESLGIDPRAFLIGTIGRWDSQKGYPILLRAIRILQDKKIRLPVLLIGGGLDKTNTLLTKVIRQYDCGDQMQLLGHRADIANIARALDLHVLPSLSEGFPNVVAETMLSGTPNATTDVGDAGRIVGDAGWIVPAGDAEQLAAAIEQAYVEWANTPARWQERRKAARTRIADNFSLDRMVESYENVWRHVATRSHEIKVKSSEPAVPQAAVEPARRPLRVLHIINSLGLGGAETLLYRLTTQDLVNEHIVISLDQPAWYSSQLQEKGIPLYHLQVSSPGGLAKGALRLNRIIRESRADVVQCWMYRSNVLGGLVAKAAGKRVVWGIHNSSLQPLKRSSRVLVRLSGVIARWNPDFIVNCSLRSAQLHDKLGYSGAKRIVVHNGYDASAFFPDDTARRAAREALGIGSEEFAIGSIARWDPLKDIPNLLTAARIAHDRGVPLRCLLIGAGLGIENVELASLIRASGSASIAVPLGSRSDVRDIARALDLHVLASRTEAFPNVVAETMLSGTPNLVTDVGDVGVMVGESGWIVPPLDPERLSKAIVEAYNEWKDERARWLARRNAARAHIADNFSFDRMAEAYERVWSQVATT